ncbi:hypothetical protein O181_075956 [Austropuccinia psidii MF-1]|uniref:Uncharacterized protein n=1 Tax=Austropuccinia psidii MF-1 TaxID=1389203 RepID=A0A9Q3FFF2_9BASI|nr:hypothetical protein [Austropuccinia psidii MF-1]
MLEKGWNPRISLDTLRKDLIYIHSTASSFMIMLYKVKHYAKKSMNESHKVPDFKEGDLVLDSNFNFVNIIGPNKLKYSYLGPFFIVSLHGNNEVQVELSGESENKHTTFPGSFIKPYQPDDKKLFPLSKPAPLAVPPVKRIENKKIKKFIKERRLWGKN